MSWSAVVPTPTGPVRVNGVAHIRPVGFGDAQARRTTEAMRQMAIANQFDEDLIRVARHVAGRSRSRDYDGYCFAIREFLQQHFSFVRDPRDADTLEPPGDQIRNILGGGTTYGDCDDAATLAASLGLAVGVECIRFVLVGFHVPNAPFEHVWTDLYGSSGWWEMDITRPTDEDIPPVTREAFVPV